MARAVLPGVPHHVTQRSVNRQIVFASRSDYQIYLELVLAAARRRRVSILGYCLMPNHVHWVVSPEQGDSMKRAFGDAHGRYAHYANSRFGRSGHFWQNRFFSCPLDRAHLWAALRYVERNPVRAGLVDKAWDWEWSSAAAHAGRILPPEWLEMEQWRDTFTCEQWRTYLLLDTLTEADLALRTNTYTGRPVGSEEFIEAAEACLGRRLRPGKGGRPPLQRCAVAASGNQARLWGEAGEKTGNM